MRGPTEILRRTRRGFFQIKCLVNKTGTRNIYGGMITTSDIPQVALNVQKLCGVTPLQASADFIPYLGNSLSSYLLP